MPKIQAYQRTKTITGEGPNVTMTGTAGIGKAVSTMGEMGTKAADSVSDFMAAQKRAERAVLAQRYEQELKDGIDEALMSFDNDGNWQGYEEKSQNFVKGLKEKHLDTIEDPVLKKSAEVYFMGQARNFERTIRRQKLQLMTKESQARFDVDYADSLKKYVYETDPQLKDLTKKEIELKGYELEQKKLMPPGTTEKKMLKFNADAEEYYITKAMNEDPEKLATELRQSGTFPNTDPKKKEELIYRADERAYREGIRKEREDNLARKKVHDSNAKDAFDRFELWKRGKKAADGKSFEDWLDENRGTDAIRESTYEHYMGRIDKAKDRSLAAGDKWTITKRIQFGQIKQKFLDPANNYKWSDIPDLVKGLPVSAADELSDILALQPSKERRQAIQVSESFINKKLEESEANPETWESTMAQWKYRSKDADLKDLQKIANEITAELPQGGLAAMMEEIKKKKGMKQEDNKQKTIPKQTEAATPPQTGYRYSPVTGNFEEIK